MNDQTNFEEECLDREIEKLDEEKWGLEDRLREVNAQLNRLHQALFLIRQEELRQATGFYGEEQEDENRLRDLVNAAEKSMAAAVEREWHAL